MAKIKNKYVNNGEPYAVRMKGTKTRKYQYKDVKKE